jgi:hypothetical protein
MIIIKPWDTVYLLYNQYWLVLVVDIPLWKVWVRQLGWLFPRYGK